MTVWSPVTVSGYNASPPPDDGSQVAANKVTWAGIKTKIGDPLNTAVAALNTSGVAMGAIVAIQGRNTYWVPGAALVARTTNGGTPATTESASNKVMMKGISFSPTTTQFAQFTVGLPKAYDKGAVTFQYHWTCTATAGDVIWGIQAQGLGDGYNTDNSFEVAREVTDTILDPAQMMTTAETSPVTIASISVITSPFVVLQVYRNATATGNTATVAATLLGARMYFNTNAADDT